MEMQNVLKQMTDMLSVNVSKELFPGSLSGTTGSKFETVMSKQMSGASQKKEMSTRKEDTANTVGVQAMGGKRQQELQDVDGSTTQKEELSTENGMQNGTGDTTEVVTQEIPEEVVETVAQWMNTMQEQICEKLNLTPEELESVMSQLGLQFTDLQDMSKVQELVLTVAGEDNVAALLTNEQLNTQVQDILQIAVQTEASFAEKLHVTEEEFEQFAKEVFTVLEQEDTQDAQLGTVTQEQNAEKEVVEVPTMLENTSYQLDEVNQGTPEFGSDAEITTEKYQENDAKVEQPIDVSLASKQTEGEETLVVSQEVVEDVTEVVEVAEEVVGATEDVADTTDTLVSKPVETDDTKKDNLQTAEHQEVVKQVETDVEEEQPAHKSVSKETITTNKTAVENTDASKKPTTSHQESGNQASLFDQMMEQVALAKAEHVESVQDKVSVVQQMREVFEQVVEQIKITVTADTSEMTMQLNPENLGKVNLSIVAKEGHITAQFVTETELARQALESQIQQLRDTLGEQGLKVDKVEVSVSDFSFAQQNNTNAEEQKEQQRSEHAKQVHRNLNLSGIEEVTDLTEEEELAVKIMRSNGNQIDFTA